MIVKHKKAPGEKFLQKLSLKQKSWLNAFGGAILYGLGQCLFVEAWFRVYNGFDRPTWLFMIMLGLIITLAGLLVIGKSLLFSSRIQTKRYYKKRRNNFVRENSQNLKNSRLNIERNIKKQ